MTHKGPLDLPEIADLVAPYLAIQSLAACVRVSKSWRDNFLSHLWSVVSTGAKCNEPLFEATPDGRWHGPCLDDIYRYRHHIRHLSLFGAPAGLEEFQYPNLHHLVVELVSCHPYRTMISLDLVEMCPLLTLLELTNISVALTTWATLSTHPHIRTLRLRNLQIEAAAAPLFWSVCANLESLVLHDITFQGEGVPRDMVFHRLRKLKMRMGAQEAESQRAELIVHFPMLESLNLSTEFPRPLIQHSIQNNHWPHLNKLHLSGLLDKDVASILGGAGNGPRNIVELGLDHCQLKTQAARILGHTFSTLVDVKMYSCKSILGATILDVLCSCQRLEVLYAGDVSAKDIVKHGPWACEQLREMTIHIQVGESEQDLQWLVFGRLSALERLEKLTMSSTSSYICSKG
ncbi:hypothetical protein BGX34_001832, partial [Mortierella sp. NVP85]